MHRTRLPLLLLLLAIGASLPGRTAEPTPGAVAFAIDRVIVFKDDFGLFVKTGTGVADRNGHLVTPDVPNAVLGTFWATGEGRDLRSTTASWVDGVDKHDEELDCASTLDLLKANPGKLVTLHLESREVTGRLVKAGDETVVVEDAGGVRSVLPTGRIQSVSGKELGTQCRRHTESPRHTKQLVFDFGPEAAGRTVKLHLLYFAPGIRWIPTYRVETGDGGEAELALQAELLNDAEELTSAAVDFVVGVPNFRFKDTPSPLSLETAMRQALVQAAPQLATQMFKNSMTYAQASNEAPALPSSSALAPDLQAEARQDLFSYSAKAVTLAKGARIAMPLWSGSAGQRHLYSVDLPLVRGGDGQRSSLVSRAGGSPLRLEESGVWHQLELANGGHMPWTTGAALVMQGLLPVAQEILGYTPAGGKTLLPLTVAVDLHATHAERELDRKSNVVTFENRSYTLVRKEGTITLTSHRKEKSTMCITVSTGGEVSEASDGARITPDEARSSDWNGLYLDPRLTHHSDVRWEITLESGQTKTLTYKLKLYE